MRSNSRKACIAVVLAALTGCNFAPPYDVPTTRPAAVYKEALPNNDADQQGWKLAEPRDAAIRSDWWQMYGDPQLSALETRVAISNQTIIAAEASYRAAFALVQEAQANLFPTLTLAPSVTREKSSAALASIGGGVLPGSTGTTTAGTTTGTTTTSATTRVSTSTHNIFALPLEATYQVDLWGSIRNTVASNRFAAQASAATLANALLSTQSTLAQDYFQLRVADEQRRILDRTVADYRLSLKLVQSLVANGVDSEADVAAAESQLASAMASATDVGVARAQYEHAIAVLIGVSPAEFSIPYRRLDQPLPVIPVGIPSDLLERRPDIAAAERQVAETNAQIGVARAAFFPTLTLGASGGYESTVLGALFNAPNKFWSAGPSLAQTLFDGRARRAAVAQARAQNESQAATYRATVLGAFQSVEDELAALRILSVEDGQAREATRAAKRALELTLTLFRNGIDSYVQLLSAETALLNAQETELGIELKRLTASVVLIDDLGGGWDVSQSGAVEHMAEHPSHGGTPAEVPGPDAAVVPNPPAMPSREVEPDDIFQQIAPAGSTP